MEPMRKHVGTAMPLNRSDVDTDQIIPASWLRRVERTGFGEGLFSEWRKDPSFPMNQPQYEGATVIVAGPNFGVGSSREHAVWALTDRGFRAVISPRFGDIFRNNSPKTGLVPVVVPAEFAEELLLQVERNPHLKIHIDVEARTVSAPQLEMTTSFEMDDATQYRLMNGLDDIGLTMQQVDDISEYESHRPSWMPRV